MTNMATTLIYGKNLWKSSSPESIVRRPWNSVCSIWVLQYHHKYLNDELRLTMTFLRQGQIWENV